jgi:hypothetical protein
MPLWKPRPVEEQPNLALIRWRIMLLHDGEHQFVGRVVENPGESKITSELKAFDIAQMRGTTATGRVYQLQGPPSHDSHAKYVWERWRRAYQLTGADFGDVCEAVYAGHLKRRGVSDVDAG